VTLAAVPRDATPEFVAAWAARDPDRPAVMFGDGDQSLTYGELEAASNQVAHTLRSLGIVPGDRIGFMLENCVEVFAIGWGALRSGAHLVPVNFHLTASETEYVVRNSGAKVVFFHAHLADVIAKAVPPDVARIVIGGSPGEGTSWEEQVLAQPSERLRDEVAGALMFYSSGTTGKPKGVRRHVPAGSPDEVRSVPAYCADVFELPRGGRLLVNGPLYHSTPLNWSMAMHTVGGTAVATTRFDAERALEIVERLSVDATQWVPTMFSKLLSLPEAARHGHDLSSMEVAWHASAPCPVVIKRRMMEWWGPIINEYYGATEAGVTTISAAEWLERPGSVGRPTPGSRVHILDPETKEPVPRGVDGQVYFEPPSVLTFEYHGEPEKTAQVVHHGLVSPGDIGHLDDDGYLFLTDRMSNLIIVGGVNVYPREVEDVLIGHPAVEDVAVLGAPDSVYGERVVAFVQFRTGVEATDEMFDQLTAFARQSLAAVKVPRAWTSVATLPREVNGKLYKRQIDVSRFAQ
jgi:long-chain acyl-CoA synthetase